MHTIESISRDSSTFNETNDCTVRALVATTGRSYADCHQALKKHGRRNRCGAYRWQWEKAANDLGFKLVDVTSQVPGRTIRTATRYLPRNRRFILQVRGHVAGWNGEKLLDWAEGRQHRIREVLEVLPAEELKPVVVKGYNDEPKPRRRDLTKFFIKVVTAKNDHTFRKMVDAYKIVTPPPRVRRDKWARENATAICAHGHAGVIELKGDAAVNHRKATGERGKVFMIFGFKRED